MSKRKFKIVNVGEKSNIQQAGFDLKQQGKKESLKKESSKSETISVPRISYKLYDVLRSVIVTEKTTALKSNNTYVFEVQKTSTKPQVKKAVEYLFGVKVKDVNTLNQQGKKKVFRGRVGVQSDTKKAYVRLEQNEILNLVGQIDQKEDRKIDQMPQVDQDVVKI